MNFFILTLLKFALLMFIFMTTLAYLQWIERKVLAHIQLRPGPNRVGPHGLLQPLSDVIKLVTKEGFIPSHVNKFFYLLAPIMAVATALVPISMIPFGGQIDIPSFNTPAGATPAISTFAQMTDLNVGVIAILSITSLGVYGIALAGWASNNKYALLGGLRSSAQMISYELPMGIALACPLLLANSLSLREVVNSQAGFQLGFIPNWAIFHGAATPVLLVAFLVYTIASFAETNRIPFDLPEAENELVAGYHTEYSSMNFAAFFMAEYANMVTVSAIATLLFLGGWHPLWPEEYGSFLLVPALFAIGGLIMLYHGFNPARDRDKISLPVFGIIFLGLALGMLAPFLRPYLMPIIWFSLKVFIILFIFIWIRGTLPRFRYDQLMHFAWGFLFPVSMLCLFFTALLVAAGWA
jgi:NADH-quinone oxidoreductase subunit H